jgi:signal transduction histidine kinase
MHVPMHRCLSTLRRRFLEQSQATSAHLDQDALLAVLLAFERVQDALDRDCAQRLLSQLSGMDALDLVVEVAHDMRSPLGSILFLVETLRKAQSGPVNTVQERQLGIVYNAAFGLSTMASDLTEMARGCERLFDMRPAPFSVAEVCRSVVDIVQPIAEEKRLEVVVRVPEMDFRVGHAAALARVLLNLTTNALKFTGAGTVEIEAKQQGRTGLVFSVRDSGPGIPPEVLSTLFDTFRRRRAPGQFAFSSAGLGLAICRKVVEGLGSELRVESAPGSGTRFHFTVDLPFASKL